MPCRHRPWSLQRLLGWALALLVAPCLANARPDAPDAALMESLGMYVASLERNLVRARDLRGLVAPTEDQAGTLDLFVRDSQLVCAHLRSRGRGLPAGSPEREVLQRFVDEWSDQRVAAGLRAAPRESALDAAVRQLARTFPEQRHASPPFRLFRP